PRTLPVAGAQPVPAPAMWIPDSTEWITRVQALNLPEFGAAGQPSLAYSPVVLGIEQADTAKLHMTSGSMSAKAFAEQLGAMKLAVADKTKAPLFELGIAEPRNDAAGLAGATALYGIDLGTNSTAGGPYGNIVADYRLASPNAETANGPADLIKAFTTPNTSFKGQQAPQMTAAMLSEQSILAYDAGSPSTPLSAVRVNMPVPGLDYPIALVSGGATTVAQAAALFQKELLKPAYAPVFAANGFRTPTGATASGFPAAHGATTAAVTPDPIKITAEPHDPVAGALALWSAANTKSRVLVLTAASSSMDQPSGFAGESRLLLTQQAAGGGLQLFTADSELGNWAFAPGLGTHDYRELVPVNELDTGDQANKIKNALGTGTTVPATGCGLFPALEAAYNSMLKEYQVGKINTIVVFTDCASSEPHGTSLNSLLSTLAKNVSQHANEPVPVVMINVGSRSIDPTLNKIANALGGGTAQDLTNPQDIVNVFLQAVVSVGP
ncbi:MAG TPA: hypothetical protein VGF84_10850, partial [Micromonosporaceae bacterium]